MSNMKKIIICTFILLILFSCKTLSNQLGPPSASPSGPRTIILNGNKISKDKVGGFVSWYCKDYVYGGKVLVEVGYFGDFSQPNLGFILYDGGFSGEKSHYARQGLNHRWNWGPNGSDYAFIVKPDATGLYYDFTTVPNGESTKAMQVYKCFQR